MGICTFVLLISPEIWHAFYTFRLTKGNKLKVRKYRLLNNEWCTADRSTSHSIEMFRETQVTIFKLRMLVSQVKINSDIILTHQ